MRTVVFETSDRRSIAFFDSTGAVDLYNSLANANAESKVRDLANHRSAGC